MTTLTATDLIIIIDALEYRLSLLRERLQVEDDAGVITVQQSEIERIEQVLLKINP